MHKCFTKIFACSPLTGTAIVMGYRALNRSKRCVVCLAISPLPSLMLCAVLCLPNIFLCLLLPLELGKYFKLWFLGAVHSHAKLSCLWLFFYHSFSSTEIFSWINSLQPDLLSLTPQNVNLDVELLFFFINNTFGVLDVNYDSLAFKPQSVYVFRAFLLVIVKFNSMAF